MLAWSRERIITGWRRWLRCAAVAMLELKAVADKVVQHHPA